MLNIYNAGAELPDVLPRNSIVHRPYQNASAHIASGSVDLVLIDPPYTDGVTDALPNHKIQTKFDINHVMSESYRILKPDGFFVFFGQMPTVLAWLNSATAVFRYKEHITWVKRMITSPYLPLQRSKEEIFIYTKGKPKYYETQARYEDLKTPALDVGIYEMSTMKTTISDLQRRVKDNAYNMIYFQGVGVDNSLSTLPKVEGEAPESFEDKVLNSIEELEADIMRKTANDDAFRGARLINAKRNIADKDFDAFDKAQKANYAANNKKNDPLTGKVYQPKDFDALDKEQKLEISKGDHNDKTLRYTSKDRVKNEDFDALDKAQKLQISHGKANDQWLEKKMLNASLERKENLAKEDNDKQKPNKKSAHRYRTKHWCNLTNTWSFLPEPIDIAVAEICTVWSYLPQNQTKFGANGENWKHPTVKPIKLYERLLRLLMPAPTEDYTPLCVDFFAGSGTLSAAAVDCGFDFIVSELQEDYFIMTAARTEKAIKDKVVINPELGL